MNRSNADGFFVPMGEGRDVGAEPLTCLDLFCGCGGFTPGIGDLPILRAGGGEDERDYDLSRRAEHPYYFGDPACRGVRSGWTAAPELIVNPTLH